MPDTTPITSGTQASPSTGELWAKLEELGDLMAVIDWAREHDCAEDTISEFVAEYDNA